MLTRVPMAVLFLGLAALSACAPGGDDPDMVTLLLPRGNAAAGKAAFIDLRCYTCHKVSGAVGLPETVARIPVPDLGISLAGQPRGAIASSIIVPDHIDSSAAELWSAAPDKEQVWLGPNRPVAEAPERRQEAAPRSLMSNYRGTMTVQQLCDLLAFLQEEAGAGRG